MQFLTVRNTLKSVPAHLFLLQTEEGRWRLVGGTPALEVRAEAVLPPDAHLPDDAYLSPAGFQRTFGPLIEREGSWHVWIGRRFYCREMSGLTPGRSMVCIRDVSLLRAGRGRLRRLATLLYEHYAAQLSARRAQWFEQLSRFAATQFSGYSDVEKMLEDAALLLECRALSLWLYNKYTEHFTLYGTHNIDPSLYGRDWFPAGEGSTIGELSRQEQEIIRFRPNPKRSPNPKVAAQFQVGYLCQLRTQLRSSLLGILNVYEPADCCYAEVEERLRLVAAAVRERLVQIRDTNRNTGTRIATKFMERAACSYSSETLDELCVNLKHELKLGGCSIFLSRGSLATSVELAGTSDVAHPEFTQRGRQGWWRSLSYKAGQGLTGGVLTSGKMRIVYDLAAHEDENSHIYDEITPPPRKGWIGVPIRCPIQNRTVGVLRAVNKLIERHGEVAAWHFVGSDVETLGNVATIVGYAWYNDHLQQQWSSQLEETKREKDEKSQFLESLGHQIIAPLQQLRNVIAKLRRAIAAPDQTDASRWEYWLEGAACTCGQMEMTVLNIAFLSDPVASAPKPVSVVRDIVHPVVNMFKLQAKVDKRTDLYFDQSLWTAAKVHVDARAARQILFVLLHNASKYCAEATIIHIDGEQDGYGEYFLLSVEDTGLPIPEGWEERVFERGVRAPNVEEQLLPGSGLGLTIARDLARANGGDLKVSRGASPVRITLFMPIAKESSDG